MDYSKIYYQLCHSRQLLRPGSKPEPAKNYETHHILPKCLGGTDENSNLVHLTFREHFIAHRLLTKFHDSPKLKTAMWLMCNRNPKGTNSRVYSYVRSEYIIAERQPRPLEVKEKIRETVKARNASHSYKNPWANLNPEDNANFIGLFIAEFIPYASKKEVSEVTGLSYKAIRRSCKDNHRVVGFNGAIQAKYKGSHRWFEIGFAFIPTGCLAFNFFFAFYKERVTKRIL